jgi:hypothetical protein
MSEDKPTGRSARVLWEEAREIVDAMGRDIGADQVIMPDTWRRHIAAALDAAASAAWEQAREACAQIARDHQAPSALRAILDLTPPQHAEN